MQLALHFAEGVSTAIQSLGLSLGMAVASALFRFGLKRYASASS
jgi:ABC-type uncharacterized transport system permease subunit